MIATEVVTKAVFQWEKQKRLIAEQTQGDKCSSTEDPRRAAAHCEKGKATAFFQRCTPETHIPTPLNCLGKKLLI